MAILSRDAAKSVLSAAGLPLSQCLGFAVEFRPEGVVTIKVEYAASAEAVEAVERVVREGRPDGVRVEIAPPEGSGSSP